jgi:dienelactone hydrolase
MRQFPIFVSSRDTHVAAVATAPDGEARGLVLLLAGTGRHNVIGSTLSACLSERLSGYGLASVRLDYAGVGDSTGTVPSWTPSDVEAAAEQARAALREVGAAVGIGSFASVGTCYGSRVALALVPEPDCTGAVCLAPPILDAGGAGRMSGRPHALRLMSLTRSNAVLRPLVLGPLRVMRRVKLRGAGSPSVGAFAHLDRVRLVFLYGRNPEDDHYSSRARQRVEAAVRGLPPEQQTRFELRMLESGPLTTFDGLRHDDQEAIVDAIVPYVLACFDVPAHAASEPGQGDLVVERR